MARHQNEQRIGIALQHLAMRDRVALVDLTAFAIFDVAGPGALDYVEYLAVNKMDVPVGRSVYTPLLNHRGTYESDLTVTRTGPDEFLLVSSSATTVADTGAASVRAPSTSHFWPMNGRSMAAIAWG